MTVLLRRADGMRRYVHTVGRVEQRVVEPPLLPGAIIDVHDQTLERMARESMPEAATAQGKR